VGRLRAPLRLTGSQRYSATNYAPALRWFRAAADQGFARAHYNLGIPFLQGRGVRRPKATPGRASSWDTWTPRGLGTQKDPEAAYFWIVSAELAGDNRGRELLAKLETVLSPQQIAEARQRAQNLPPEGAQQFSARAFAQ
jgi:TPR repeat protein